VVCSFISGYCAPNYYPWYGGYYGYPGYAYYWYYPSYYGYGWVGYYRPWWSASLRRGDYREGAGMDGTADTTGIVADGTAIIGSEPR